MNVALFPHQTHITTSHTQQHTLTQVMLRPLELFKIEKEELVMKITNLR